MPSLVDSISSFVSSIFGAFASILNSILALFQNLLGMVFDLIRTAFASIGALISGLVHTFQGLFKFLLSESKQWEDEMQETKLTVFAGNILVIGGILAALFLYGVYMQRGGQAPVRNKKLQ
jgi:ABC-type proline/glycine betaine transport system permease subunit